MVRKALVILALAASPAVAQQTQCYTSGGYTNCTTTTPPTFRGSENFREAMGPLADPSASFQQGQQDYLNNQEARQNLELQRQQIRQNESYARAQREIAQERLVLAAERERLEANRQEVGKLLIAGKCDDAVQLALGLGAIDLANQAKTYCVDHAPQK